MDIHDLQPMRHDAADLPLTATICNQNDMESEEPYLFMVTKPDPFCQTDMVHAEPDMVDYHQLVGVTISSQIDIKSEEPFVECHMDMKRKKPYFYSLIDLEYV